MSKIYSPATRGYHNITTGAGRLLLVIGGAYLIFKPKEVTKKTPYKPIMKKATISYFSQLNTEGVVDKDIQDGDVIQGARDQIQVSYRVTGVSNGMS